jgi:hypothetical protein
VRNRHRADRSMPEPTRDGCTRSWRAVGYVDSLVITRHARQPRPRRAPAADPR